MSNFRSCILQPAWIIDGEYYFLWSVSVPCIKNLECLLYFAIFSTVFPLDIFVCVCRKLHVGPPISKLSTGKKYIVDFWWIFLHRQNYKCQNLHQVDEPASFFCIRIIWPKSSEAICIQMEFFLSNWTLHNYSMFVLQSAI